MDIHDLIDEKEIKQIFNLIMGRSLDDDPNSPRYIKILLDARVTIDIFIRSLMISDEFKSKNIPVNKSDKSIEDYKFTTPEALQVTVKEPSRVLLVGSCLLAQWQGVLSKLYPNTRFDLLTFNYASRLPPLEPDVAHDFQIAQIPIRSLIEEPEYFQLRANDEAAHQQLFDRVLDRLALNLTAITEYNRTRGTTVYLLNFFGPQQHPAGRQFPRYTLADPVTFVEQMNRALQALVDKLNDVHVVDFDRIISIFGRKYFQDDSIVHWNHGSDLESGFYGRADAERLEPTGNIRELYAPRLDRYVEATYRDILARRRSAGQIDAVKLVIFDIDDSLWRGVAAEMEYLVIDDLIGGWPLGILEAAAYLWKRGVLLAIVSKNDEQKIVKIWDEIYGAYFGLDKFCARKINWRSKAENIAEILGQVNLLPQNVLFVDDNPVERATIKAAFPGMRTLDVPLAEWRRVLLWSPELQTSAVTAESSERTAMVRSQIQREAERAQFSKADFLASLHLRVRMGKLNSPQDPVFARCFELLNKTNQFNTNGRRWSPAEMAAFLAGGGLIRFADVADKFTRYGIVAVMLTRGARIEQFVMSCRVFGLGVEETCVAVFCRTPPAPGAHFSASIVDTGNNRLCHGLYAALGFLKQDDGEWLLTAEAAAALAPPTHVALE